MRRRTSRPRAVNTQPPADGRRPDATVAVYPGSFDPVTNGHVDIIRRAALYYPRLIVAVLTNPSKSPLLPLRARMLLLQEVCGNLSHVEVDCFDGLLVDFVRRRGATLIVKGLRIVSDFEHEFSMALLNRKLRGGADTMFLPASLEYAYVSSSFVREVFSLGGDISEFVPAAVLRAMMRMRVPHVAARRTAVAPKSGLLGRKKA